MKAILILILFANQLFAQSFGQNKVQYDTFDWEYVVSPNTNVYYYGDNYDLAIFTSKVAEKSLEQTLIKENADWGCVIMMEVKTGEVKVIANLRKDTSDRVSEYFNYAIAQHDAPGSTFKLASIILFEEFP